MPFFLSNLVLAQQQTRQTAHSMRHCLQPETAFPTVMLTHFLGELSHNGCSPSASAATHACSDEHQVRSLQYIRVGRVGTMSYTSVGRVGMRWVGGNGQLARSFCSHECTHLLRSRGQVPIHHTCDM